MNQKDILKMEAGREMDALIEKELIKGFYTFHGEYPNYSTNIAAAWEAIKEMNRKNYYVHMGILPSYSYATFINAKNGISGWQGQALPNELPLAICRAALLAIM